MVYNSIINRRKNIGYIPVLCGKLTIQKIALIKITIAYENFQKYHPHESSK